MLRSHGKITEGIRRVDRSGGYLLSVGRAVRVALGDVKNAAGGVEGSG